VVRVKPTSRASWRAIFLVLVLFCSVLGITEGAAATAEPKESAEAFQQQLASGSIASARINKRLRWVHVVLKDGRRFIFVYPPHHQEPRVQGELKAKHVAVTVMTPAEAKQEHGSSHHKIRYIVGGVVLLVIVIAAAVLLVNRGRRRRD
jgi:ATP-dependent Zn protease